METTSAFDVALVFAVLLGTLAVVIALCVGAILGVQVMARRWRQHARRPSAADDAALETERREALRRAAATQYGARGKNGGGRP